jgi:hypothetical protein
MKYLLLTAILFLTHQLPSYADTQIPESRHAEVLQRISKLLRNTKFANCEVFEEVDGLRVQATDLAAFVPNEFVANANQRLEITTGKGVISTEFFFKEYKFVPDFEGARGLKVQADYSIKKPGAITSVTYSYFGLGDVNVGPILDPILQDGWIPLTKINCKTTTP